MRANIAIYSNSERRYLRVILESIWEEAFQQLVLFTPLVILK